jgi:hypothetical protein
MSSDFDSRVSARQHHTPWATIQVRDLLSSLTLFGDASTHLYVVPRPEVSSHLWWALEWTDASGKPQRAEAATCDKLCWRAAEVELTCRAAMSGQRHTPEQGEETPDGADHH